MIQPQASPAPVTAPAAPIAPAATRTSPSASAIYEGFRAQRRELSNQLDELQDRRREITSQMEDLAPGSPERTPLEARLKDVDARINSVDQMLAGNSAQLAQAAAVPGAVIEQPPPPTIVREGPPEEAYVLGALFMVIALLPISIAFARRIWKRSAAAITSLPRDISDRLMRMEQAVEATAVEVERIGEGQRFLTRLFTEGEGARMLGAGAAQPIEQRSRSAPDRLP